MKRPLRILLVNERGCFDPGIMAMAKILGDVHNVVVVAPRGSIRGQGHSLTATAPIRAEQFAALSKARLFAVDGTPCDCVGLALDKLLRSKPDLIISGIDPYHNVGDIIYSSGVVMAAICGTNHGIPSMAVSAHITDRNSEKEYLSVARAVLKKLDYLRGIIKPGIALNVNFPLGYKTKEFQICPLTVGMAISSYSYKTNPFGREFYWLNKNIEEMGLKALNQKGDVFYLKKGVISITPLSTDMTADGEAFEALRNSGIAL